MMTIPENKLIHNGLTAQAAGLPLYLTGHRLGFYWVATEISANWESWLQTVLTTGADK